MLISIEDMKACHIDAVAELEKACFHIPWSRRSFCDELNNPLAHYFVAMVDSTVAGYCGIWDVAGEGHITNVAVHPAFRRRHAASALLERVFAHAKQEGLTLVTLEVRESNYAARRLYSKYGFEKIGIRKRYYGDNHEDAVIMTKNF